MSQQNRAHQGGTKVTARTSPRSQVPVKCLLREMPRLNLEFVKTTMGRGFWKQTTPDSACSPTYETEAAARQHLPQQTCLRNMLAHPDADSIHSAQVRGVCNAAQSSAARIWSSSWAMAAATSVRLWHKRCRMEPFFFQEAELQARLAGRKQNV